MQGSHLAFEPHLSFHKMREQKLLDSFSLWAEFFLDFFSSFSYWLDEFAGILSQLLKKGVSTPLAFEKLGELSIGF